MPRTPESSCGSCAIAGTSRRRFVTQTLLATVGAWLVQACGDGSLGGPGAPREVPPIAGGTLVVNLSAFPTLAMVGGIARVDGDTDTPIAVARLATDSFVALSMVCTHQGFAPIDIQAAGFRCPNHGARFNADGTWSGGQSTTDLLRYPLVYNAVAGTLTIG